jgi:hypothetical protein
MIQFRGFGNLTEIGLLLLFHGRELKQTGDNALFTEADATSNMGATKGVEFERMCA